MSKVIIGENSIREYFIGIKNKKHPPKDLKGATLNWIIGLHKFNNQQPPSKTEIEYYKSLINRL